MTIEDLLAREAISRTMADYTIAGDRLREDDFAACFAEDAILESEGVPAADLFRYEGRAEIRRWIGRWRERPADPDAEQSEVGQGRAFIRHHLATSQIELTGADEARARTYWTAYTAIGPDHCGYYLDRFRRVDDRWLIVHRRIRLDWRSADSLYTTAVRRVA